MPSQQKFQQDIDKMIVNSTTDSKGESSQRADNAWIQGLLSGYSNQGCGIGKRIDRPV